MGKHHSLICRNGHVKLALGRCPKCWRAKQRRYYEKRRARQFPDGLLRDRLHAVDELGLPTRFWLKVTKTDTCWLWRATKTVAGYGMLKVAGVNKMAHRLAYEAAHGPIAEGLHVDHLCRVPACVRPAHLEPVTPGENVRRGLSHTNRLAAQTHCKRGHLLDEANTYVCKRGCRNCRQCSRAREAAWRARSR